MKVVYTLLPKKEATVKGAIASPYIFKIDETEVNMELDANKITKLKIVFHGVDYDLSPLGNQTKIVLRAKELRYSAYKICSYISNRIYTESGTDAFDCNELVDNDAPEIYPENQKEQEDISCSDIFRSHNFRFVQSIENFVDLKGWHSEGYKYEKAYTAYADGLRANSIFTRYVQIYKAMEACFENGKVIDQTVSDIVSDYNLKISAKDIENFREIRNRCEHPNTYHPDGHLSSSDIQNIKEVETNLPDLIKVVKTLFSHFKKSKDRG